MKRILEWKPNGKRPLGRPKQKLIDKIQKDLVEIGLENGGTTAQDRWNTWYRDRLKQACVAVMGLNGL